ncbi:zinc finger, CCHC-type containing protein [Tanacetum coccineum]
MTTKFGKFVKFEGNDLRRWQKKMHFLLTTLKVVYLLSTPMPEFVEDEMLEKTRKRCKWENDNYICSAMELWDQLESKYMAEYASSKKFLVSNFNNYKMVDSRILKHNKDELSLVQLEIHFRIEETIRAEESGKGKGKEIAGSSSVNMIEYGKNKNNNKNNKEKKRKNDRNNDGSNKKSKLTCWKCSKTGHFKKDCRLKKNNGGNTSSLGQGSKDPNSSQGMNFDFIDDAFAWWIDSVATYHACKDRCWFDNFDPVQDGFVLHMADESTKSILGRGNVLEFSSGKTITLVNVVYVSGLRKNLIYYNNGIFMLNLNKVSDAFSSVCMISSKDVNSSMWHACLGHVHYKRMLAMSKDNLIPKFYITLGKCNTCMLTKITIHPFKDIKEDSNVLELIHSDLCDFHATPSLGNKKYVVSFINDASRFCYVYLCHSKDEALDKFKICKTEVELQQNDLIKTLRTDRGDEYYEHVYFQSVGIIHETMAPYTPQQNGVTERKNRALKEMVNSMLSYPGLRVIEQGIEEDPRMFDEAMQSRDIAFWKEAINDEMNSIIENNTWILSDLPPGKVVDQLEYFREIRCLMYPMTSTRTDIIYTVVLEGYSDANWITNSEDHNSTTKFVALAAAGKEVEWLRNLIYEIPLWPKLISPISIHSDSAATLAKAYYFVQFQQNMADHLTKGLARDLMHKSAIGMGLKSTEISYDDIPNSLPANVGI